MALARLETEGKCAEQHTFGEEGLAHHTTTKGNVIDSLTS